MPLDRSNWKIDPITTAISDCDTAVAEGADAADMARAGQLGADEALINAMGSDWVLDAAGVDLATNTDEDAWVRVGIPWCAAYNAAFRARAAELAARAGADMPRLVTAKTELVRLRVTPSAKKAWKAQAVRAGLSLTDWLSRLAAAAAAPGRQVKPPPRRVGK